MRNLITITFFFTLFNAYSIRELNREINKQDYIDLKNSKIYVVLNHELSKKDIKHFKMAVDSSWTFCQYEFIDHKRYYNLKDSNYFFMHVLSFNHRVDQAFYPFVELNISNGAPKCRGKLIQDMEEKLRKKWPDTWGDWYGKWGLYNGNKMADILVAPPFISTAEMLKRTTDKRNDVGKTIKYDYFPYGSHKKLSLFVKNLQNYCEKVVNEKYTNTKDRSKDIKISRNKITKKTLLIPQERITKSIKVERIIEIYSGKVKILPESEIDSLILENEDFHVVHCTVNTRGNSYMRIFDVQSGELIYLDLFRINPIKGKYYYGVKSRHVLEWKKGFK